MRMQIPPPHPYPLPLFRQRFRRQPEAGLPLAEIRPSAEGGEGDTQKQGVRGYWVFLFLIFWIVMPRAYAMPASDTKTFEAANTAYRAGKYDEAASLYKKLANKNPDQAVFHYNLGNALYRKGELGHSILSYERARFLAPRSGDILHNLSYAQNQVEYRIQDKRNAAIQIGEKILSYVTVRELAAGTLAALFFFLLFAAWGLHGGSALWTERIRHAALWIFLIFLSAFILKEVQVKYFREAVVLAKDVQVYYGPSVNDQQAFKLSEGVRVYVRDTRENWSRIVIASGESGWIQNEYIEAVIASLTAFARNGL